MSTGDTYESLSLSALDPAIQVLGQWTGSLVAVIESMADQRPEVQFRAEETPLPDDLVLRSDLLWWEQPFRLFPDWAIWVAAPEPAWEYAGTATLKAAGLETVEIAEARNTWLEILGQSLSALGRAIGARLGREVSCDAGSERAPRAGLRQWASVTLRFGETALEPLLVVFSPTLVGAICAPNTPEDSETGEIAAIPPPPDYRPASHPNPRNMDLLLDVDLPVSISFGKTQLPMKDVLKLTTGSIVELNRGVGEQVEVLVNQCLIARGEVVVVDGNYGVRIQEIVSRQDRLRSVR